MKTKYVFKLTGLFLSMLILFSSCKKDKTENPAPSNQGELITTVHLVFTDTISGIVTDTATFRDIDGPGGLSPEQDSILLQAGSVYHARVILLDESKSPALVISDEVANESDVHLFVFSASPASGFLTSTVTDADMNGLPVGLESNVACGPAATGAYTLELRHFDSPALKQANTNFETDVQVSFGARLY